MIDIVADEGGWTKGIETKRKSSRRFSFIYILPCNAPVENIPMHVGLSHFVIHGRRGS